ncbi:hypothetical protein FQA47_020838 [Oryzias melastigma]|uniref:Uncharacterized protein n=1 Tax=Oryzias melastigma TaxID=30732 RepID=A0A834CS86_ORYME|nr:hypothetical protein FQA47_020838 [Oryzias melastigma]
MNLFVFRRTFHALFVFFSGILPQKILVDLSLSRRKIKQLQMVNRSAILSLQQQQQMRKPAKVTIFILLSTLHVATSEPVAVHHGKGKKIDNTKRSLFQNVSSFTVSAAKRDG